MLLHLSLPLATLGLVGEQIYFNISVSRNDSLKSITCLHYVIVDILKSFFFSSIKAQIT